MSKRKVYLVLSPGAAQFLHGMVEHLNNEKMLPEDDAEALRTSAWLEEIGAVSKDPPSWPSNLPETGSSP